MKIKSNENSENTTAGGRRVLSVLLMFCMMNVPLIDSVIYAGVSPAAPDPNQAGSPYYPYSPQQLDNLLAPIALYPDPLLAQVLPAATFPDQIEEAARYVRANGVNGVDSQYWDVSVKAVAHYPAVLYMMADKIDWTTATGQAYVNQSTDVMMAVQRLRGMAHAQGNLASTPQQEVIVRGGYITIVPAQPRYVYVPVYDPAVIYFHRVHVGVLGAAITFGAGFVIGAWLNRDCDWHYHRVFYHGWHGGGWIGRSRPVVHVTNVYVNNSYTNINVNRTVINRHVNYTTINHYNSVHHDVTFDNHARNHAPSNPNDKAFRHGTSMPAREINQHPSAQRIPGHPPVNKPASRDLRSSSPAPAHQPAPAIQPRSQSAPHGMGRNGGGSESRAVGQQGQAARSEKNQVHRQAAGHSKDSKSESKHQEDNPHKRQ